MGYNGIFAISPGDRRISEPSTVFQVSPSSFNFRQMKLEQWLNSRARPINIEAMDFPRT